LAEKQVGLKLCQETYRELEKIAERKNLTIPQVIYSIIRKYLQEAKNEKGKKNLDGRRK